MLLELLSSRMSGLDTLQEKKTLFSKVQTAPIEGFMFTLEGVRCHALFTKAPAAVAYSMMHTAYCPEWGCDRREIKDKVALDPPKYIKPSPDLPRMLSQLRKLILAV